MDSDFPAMTNEKVRQKALEVLTAGGVVVLPTDTLHGLSAMITSGQAIRRIAAIKGDTHRMQFLLLAGSLSMVERYIVSFGCVDRATLEQVWPAAVTLILPAGSACPEWLGDTIAFRIPDKPQLQDLIERLGEPVISTSVNRTGEQPIVDLEEIKTSFGGLVDMIVAGETNTLLASTIVDLTGTAPQVIRKGDYVWDEPV